MISISLVKGSIPVKTARDRCLRPSASMGSRNETTTSPFRCLRTSEHSSGPESIIVGVRAKRELGMPTRRHEAAAVADRPYNNLLRRLNAADFGLIAPHLVKEEAEAG